jgi:hypothetical protein
MISSLEDHGFRIFEFFLAQPILMTFDQTASILEIVCG